MRRVGITGGAGFIGTHVKARLEALGYEPVIFDTRGRGDGHVMLGDVRDDVSVTELAAHVDGIIHLAAVLGTQETIRNPRPAAHTNVLGTLNVLAAAHQYDIPVVNICVGNWTMRNTYSTTKHCAERLVEQYRDELGLRAVNVRCVNAYGPGQSAAAPYGSAKVRKIIPAFVCRALNGQPIEVYGTGEQVSAMVHVRDVARALVAALETTEPPKTVVEVGPWESTRVIDVARMVSDIAGPVSIVNLPMRPGEDPSVAVTADPSTLFEIGIDPESLIDLRVGLEETVEWFRR